MFARVLATAMLCLTVSANMQVKRQATDAAQFTSAADQLISQYIPSTALPALESAISSAASVAQITGEPLSLIYEALLSSSIPGWFSSAVPSAYSTQIAALESNINALRVTSTPGGPLLPVATVVTTTNSAGSAITTTLSPSSTGPSSSATVTSTSITGLLTTTTTTPSGTATGAGSVVSSLTTEVISGVTSIFSTAVSTAVSKASSVASVASSAVSSAVSSSTSSAGGSLPTAVSRGAAVGMMGIFGLVAAM
ncbi:uncharacterized protein LY89DRAFT_779047 [Mollisia scopiformis]|uniref:Uncharacterized protein n=1 Tax=Mollisia scopiformis TaxID=149040 RepID=A0A194XJF2_MOLSC|nr:uncharacterized protein LY89DRAFT_779047 [Mollisia scopiformis]KUJ20254.1 hypothetical protein LY89DRAFT_779047 [Mollisia scopiformis]